MPSIWFIAKKWSCLFRFPLHRHTRKYAKLLFEISSNHPNQTTQSINIFFIFQMKNPISPGALLRFPPPTRFRIRFTRERGVIFNSWTEAHSARSHRSTVIARCGTYFIHVVFIEDGFEEFYIGRNRVNQSWWPAGWCGFDLSKTLI